MSKNNLRGITLVIGSIWGIRSLTLIISCVIKENPKFPTSRRILHILQAMALSWRHPSLPLHIRVGVLFSHVVFQFWCKGHLFFYANSKFICSSLSSKTIFSLAIAVSSLEFSALPTQGYFLYHQKRLFAPKLMRVFLLCSLN